MFITNDGVYHVINKDDDVIFSSRYKIRIIEIPNHPIIAVKKEDKLSEYHTNYYLELYNLKGERIFKEFDDIHDAKPFSNGKILIGLKSEANHVYPVTIPIFDRDEDGDSYCEEYHTWDINTKDITLWGLYTVDENELLAREYFEIKEEPIFNMLKISKICGNAKRGFFQVYGFADFTGTIILDPLYEDIEVFTDSLIKVKQNNRYGLIDYAFKPVIPCRYETLDILDDESQGDFQKKAKFPFFKTEKGILIPTGLLIAQSEKARILLPRRVCHITNFKNGIAIFCNDSTSRLLYGLVNHFGEYIVEDKYVKITQITEKVYKCENPYGTANEFDLFVITKEYKASLVGSFDCISTPTGNSIGIGKKMDSTSSNFTYGIIDLDGKWILETCSSTIGEEIDNYRTITVAGKVGFVHIETKRVVLISDANFIGPIHNGIASFAIGVVKDKRTNVIKGGKWGVVNKYGEEIIPPKYSKIFTDKYGRIYFKNGSPKVGMINEEERIIIRDEYDFLHENTDENYIVFAKETNCHKGTLYYFDNNGELQETEQYDEYEGW